MPYFGIAVTVTKVRISFYRVKQFVNLVLVFVEQRQAFGVTHASIHINIYIYSTNILHNNNFTSFRICEKYFTEISFMFFSLSRLNTVTYRCITILLYYLV